jgi:hypothetical protein
MLTGFEGVLNMATVSSGLPPGQAGAGTGQLQARGRLRELFASAMAAAMGAVTADLPFSTAEPVLSGEACHKPDALPGDFGFPAPNVHTGASWEVLEAGPGSTRKVESALLHPGITPGEPQAVSQAQPQSEFRVTPPALKFDGAAYGERSEGETGHVGVGEAAPEPVIELREEEPVVLRLLHVPTDHALPAEPGVSARLARARLALEFGDTVSPEVTPDVDKTGETHSREGGFGSPEVRTLLPGDSISESDAVPAVVKGEARRKEDLPEVAKTSRTLVPAAAENAGDAHDPGRAAGVGEVVGEREISPIHIRALAERLREEALKRLPRTVEIRLDPPRLGSVTAVLSARGPDIAVKFVASTPEAGRALDASQGDLAKCLYEQGLTLAGFSVDHGASGDGPPRGERGSTVSSRGRTGRGVTRAEATPHETVGLAHLMGVSRSHLDYVV